jgi:hypothetical protein
VPEALTPGNRFANFRGRKVSNPKINVVISGQACQRMYSRKPFH